MRRIRELTRAIAALEAELGPMVAALAPGLLAERGCGTLTAAKLIGEIAGIGRFATDAKLARTAAAAPIPASSDRTDRHRLDRGGNRQLNCALHRLAVSKVRLDPETAAYVARKQAEGKTRREALRCLKRHLARRVFPADLRPSLALTVLVGGAVPAAAVVVTLLALGRTVVEPLSVLRRARGGRRRLWWRLAIPALGLVALAPLLGGIGAGFNPVPRRRAPQRPRTTSPGPMRRPILTITRSFICGRGGGAIPGQQPA